MNKKYSEANCPICGEIAQRDVNRLNDDKMQGYYCKKCGDYALCRGIDIILNENVNEMLYVNLFYSVNDYDENTLRDAIKTYMRSERYIELKKKYKSIWFCEELNDYVKDESREYVNIRDLYDAYISRE